MRNSIICGMLLAAPITLMAEGSPWLTNPGETVVQFSVVSQEADKLYAGENRVDVPVGDLEQMTYWLSLSHGLSDNLAMDARLGYSQTDSTAGLEQDGIADTTVGLTWRFHDEFLSDEGLPSAAIRVAATLAGDYDTGQISAIGDGASGFEASIILGKVFNNQFAASADIGYRYRDSDVPNEMFLNLSAFYTINDQLSAHVAYHRVDARDGLDIGGPGFSPDRFPEVEEDYDSFEIGISYAVAPEFYLGLSYGAIVDGRNAPESDIVSASVGYSF